MIIVHFFNFFGILLAAMLGKCDSLKKTNMVVLVHMHEVVALKYPSIILLILASPLN